MARIENTVFISYSHKDEEWKDRLVTHLGVLERQGILDLWNDRRIALGDDWRPEIENAISRASIAILMVSANFLTSKFIVDEELPKFLERRANDGLRVIPLIVRPCAWKRVDWLAKLQGGTKDNKPLSSGSEYEIDSVLAALTDKVAEIIQNAEFHEIPETSRAASRAASPAYAFEPQMVNIPAGTFTMGSNDNHDEKPPHKVNLSEYFIGKYPVTNREYQAFVKDAKYKAPKGWNGDQFPQNKAEHPVVNVSWHDAVAYCAWLSKKTGKTYRLPTEAEWEKAARGTDGRKYPWGNKPEPNRDLLNYNDNVEDTTEVGSYEDGHSPYGVYDMAGNVWEWVHDWYSTTYYQKSPPKNPLGPNSGKYRVLRGGSWNNVNNYARSANRVNDTPDYVGDLIGFRCARSLP